MNPDPSGHQPIAPSEVPRQRILDFLACGLAADLSEPERLQFIEVAHTYSLDPFRREIHAIPGRNGSRMTLVVGYEVYLKRAELSGLLDGWKAWVEGAGDDTKAVVEIYRRDWAHPFIHEAFLREVAPQNADGFWSKMPRFQLKKVATTQAMRLCFPEALGGLPYDPAELGLELPSSTQNQVTGHQQNNRPAPPPPARGSTQTPPVVTTSPNPDRSVLRSRIEGLMNTAPADFNPKHRSWVLGRFDSASTPEEAKRLLGYVEKVLRGSRQAPANEPVF